MKSGFFKISLPIVTTVLVVSSVISFSAITNVFAWAKYGGVSCQNVFAKIQNDNHYRYSDSSKGYVKYVRTETDNDGNSAWEWKVGPLEGDVSNNAWVDVSWTPPVGFAGDVEVLAAIYEDKSSSYQSWDDTGDFLDYKKVTGHINCPAPTPSPSPSPTPSVSPSPTPTLSPTPSVSPSPAVSPSPTPSTDDGECEDRGDCNTGNPDPTPTPSPTPSVDPSPTPSTGGSNNGSGTSSSSSSNSNNNSTGQVAGTKTGPETLASTGTAANTIGFLGISMLTLGLWQAKRTKLVAITKKA